MPVDGQLCDGPVVARNNITRERHVELVNIASDIIKSVDALGVKRDEYCYFGNIVSQMIQLDKA